MRSLYPSSKQVDCSQSSLRSSLSRVEERRDARAGQTHRSHTSSASLQEKYLKELRFNLLGVGSQFANFGNARCYQPSLCAKASTENKSIHEDDYHIDRSSTYEHELEVLDSTPTTDFLDEGKSRQQELEQIEDKAHGEVMPNLLISVALW